jgi:hypothetical protein
LLASSSPRISSYISDEKELYSNSMGGAFGWDEFLFEGSLLSLLKELI